jgi:hypothetical protein
MSWLRRLFGNDEPNKEAIRKTREQKLTAYKDLRKFAAREGDTELYRFAKKREEVMLQMLQGEYYVVRNGR